MQKGKELNDFQRNPLDIEILSNLRFGSLEIRDTSVTRVTNNIYKSICVTDPVPDRVILRYPPPPVDVYLLLPIYKYVYIHNINVYVYINIHTHTYTYTYIYIYNVLRKSRDHLDVGSDTVTVK